MNFLEQSAEQIWEEYQDGISDHLFLFPSRRSMLYFKRAITEVAGHPLWVPDCMTLDQWVMEQSNLIPADSITAAYKLFQAAREVDFVTYKFELFYPLAQIILSDFEEVDVALINPGEIWTQTTAWQNTPEHPHAQVWNEMRDTPLKKRWEVNWNKLRELYETFGRILEKEGLSTKGRIYRKVIDQFGDGNNLSYPRIHVIGFSSLRPVDVRILDHLKSLYSVSFFWNLIPELNAPGLDAGARVFPWSEVMGQDLLKYQPRLPQVEIVAVPGMVTQMKMISRVLETTSGAEEQMAVVLPHPSMIDLLISSFPDNRSWVNISMGFPLIYSPARSMLEWILTLWETIENQEGRIKSAELELVFSHVYIESYFSSRGIRIELPAQLYFDAKELNMENPLTDSLFRPIDSTQEALNRMIEICEEIAPAQQELFHREVLRFVKGRLVRLHDVLTDLQDVSYVFLKRILVEMMQESSIPFRGEPMQGVQILGLQEVQNLSFDTLIIPGLNEEVLPSGNIKSMIPFSLRRHYKLEDLSDKLSTQSYYLWSAILQARRVFLLHSQGTDFLGAKGLSRYLFQLKYGGMNVEIKERVLELDLSGFNPGSKEVFLTSGYENRLKEYLQREGLSATALISYVTCPFQFFLRYILRIREDDVATAGLDYRQMGSAIHDVMHRLYEPWLGKRITERDFNQIKSSITRITKEAYEALYPGDSPDILDQGVHWVEQEIIVQAVERMVDLDLQLDNLVIASLEADQEIFLNTERIPNIRLRGKIDRLDRVDGIFRVIDYKTGVSHLNQKTLEANWNDRTPVHNWQLYFYGYLMKEALGAQPFTMGHYTLKDRNVFASMVLKNKTIFDAGDLKEFEEVLIRILDEMTDPEIPFRQTADTNPCKYCAFNTFCERQSG